MANIPNINDIALSQSNVSNKLRGHSSQAELWELLTQIGFGNIELSKQILDRFKSTLREDDWRLPIVRLGDVRQLSFQGKMFESFNLLHTVTQDLLVNLNLLPAQVSDEAQALLLFIKTGIFFKLQISTGVHLDYMLGGRLTALEKFKLAFDYGTVGWLLKRDLTHPQKLVDIATILEQENLFPLASAAYRSTGTYFDNNNLFSEAMQMGLLPLSSVLDLFADKYNESANTVDALYRWYAKKFDLYFQAIDC